VFHLGFDRSHHRPLPTTSDQNVQEPNDQHDHYIITLSSTLCICRSSKWVAVLKLKLPLTQTISVTHSWRVQAADYSPWLSGVVDGDFSQIVSIEP